MDCPSSHRFCFECIERMVEMNIREGGSPVCPGTTEDEVGKYRTPIYSYKRLPIYTFPITDNCFLNKQLKLIFYLLWIVLTNASLPTIGEKVCSCVI